MTFVPGVSKDKVAFGGPPASSPATRYPSDSAFGIPRPISLGGDKPRRPDNGRLLLSSDRRYQQGDDGKHLAQVPVSCNSASTLDMSMAEVWSLPRYRRLGHADAGMGARQHANPLDDTLTINADSCNTSNHISKASSNNGGPLKRQKSRRS